MTTYTDKGPKPQGGLFLKFDHLTFWVNNAKQTSEHYSVRMGFRKVAYQGLETGSRITASHVIQQNDIFFVFTSALEPDNPKEMLEFSCKHGDAVKDVAFTVLNLDYIFNYAVKNGAEVVRKPYELKDENGKVRIATLRTYGDCSHTLVDRSQYKGVFLPGFQTIPPNPDPLTQGLPDIGLERIDHVVGNQPMGTLENIAKFYEKAFQFHRFWSVDDSIMHTEYSALSSIVVTNYEETVKLPLNEPAISKRKSQIQEYVDYHGGAGVQHIAMHTSDIISSVRNLKKRGIGFLDVPKKYYDNLRLRLKKSPIKVQEDINELEKLRILVDYDEGGYLLQIFTKNAEDRPTLFFEVIQRRNNNGFGAGNFKSLFESIEMDQEKRGNL